MNPSSFTGASSSELNYPQPMPLPVCQLTSVAVPFNRETLTDRDQVGHLDGGLARFGKSYIGEPDVLIEQLAQDAAVQAADTVHITVPNQLGVEYNAQLLDSVVRFVAPNLGWR
jgi:alkanesulfonate monooxygenase SsuD/methylene tetrahydromethanopterin reductase-like flavin-dependent oxidoreductase (luciferase family)